MKGMFPLVLIVLLIGSVFLASGAPLISQDQAQEDAVNAIGGGNVTLISKAKELGKIVWLVNVTDDTRDLEVLVDAHNGSILQIRTEPGVQEHGHIDEQQAEQAAMKAAGGGTVIQIQMDRWKGCYAWDVTITQPGSEYDVYVNAHSAVVLATVKRQLVDANQRMITKVEAIQSAMKAIGGGKLLLVGLETNDASRDWAVDVKAKNGTEYETKVNAYTGGVIAIRVGG